MVRDFLKKNLWLINVFAIGLIAWMAGAVAAEVTAGVLTREQKVPPVHFRMPVVHTGKVMGADMLSILNDRNPFNADHPKTADDQDQTKDDDTGPDQAGPADAADLGVKLLGVLYSPNPAWSLATIRFGADTKLVREGVSIMNGAATVKHIAPRYIVVTRNKQDYIVRLWAKKDNANTRRPNRFARRFRHRGPVPSYMRKSYSKWVRKVGPYEYQVDRDMLMQNLQNLSALGMQARIIPNYRNGHYEGFRLVGVRPNSLYAALGIRSGDVIQRVNGMDLNSPNKALELFNQLQSSSSISLDLTRYGKKITMNYKVK